MENKSSTIESYPNGKSAPTNDDGLDYSAYNILIVDDTPTNLGVVVEFLQQLGFGIRIARSGESAIKRIRYDKPDIILLDVLMPGIDGFETCRRLKEEENLKDIPVIFMTSLTRVEDKVRGFQVGAVDYVTKPLSQREVLARVTTHLRLLDLTKSLRAKHEQLKVMSEAETARLFDAVNQQQKQLRTLAKRLTDVQELERKQLARELHDEMGQALTALSINLAAIESELVEAQLPGVEERLRESRELVALTLDQIREISVNLRPPMLDELGLFPTLDWYVKRYRLRTGIEAKMRVVGEERRLAAEVETAVYRVIQEALTNVVRHAAATAVQLTIILNATQISLNIKDNGVGFEVNEALEQMMAGQGAGLLGIRERVVLLGGELNITSKAAVGTHLEITLPLGQES